MFYVVIAIDSHTCLPGWTHTHRLCFWFGGSILLSGLKVDIISSSLLWLVKWLL